MQAVSRKIKEQDGYSMVEVLAAIMILAIAIIPMIGMFDAGLRAAALGGNYDQARALAGKQTEIAKSLPYVEVKNNFPSSPSSFNGSGTSTTIGRTDPEPIFSNYTYDVTKQFVNPPASGSPNFTDSATDKGMMRVTVTVRWDGKSFENSMLKTR